MDIVEWLRNSSSTEWNGEMLNKVADEIERLRAARDEWCAAYTELRDQQKPETN